MSFKEPISLGTLGKFTEFSFSDLLRGRVVVILLHLYWSLAEIYVIVLYIYCLVNFAKPHRLFEGQFIIVIHVGRVLFLLLLLLTTLRRRDPNPIQWRAVFSL